VDSNFRFRARSHHSRASRRLTTPHICCAMARSTFSQPG
jgi:hypothetical protein